MARFTEEAAPDHVATLGARISRALNDEGVFSVEMVAVGTALKLRFWDGPRKDQSNDRQAVVGKEY